MADSVDEIEKAVYEENLPEIVRVYERILPAARNIQSQFKHPRLREVFSQTIRHVEDLVQQLKSPKAHIDHVNEFLRKVVVQSTILLEEILIEVQEQAASN